MVMAKIGIYKQLMVLISVFAVQADLCNRNDSPRYRIQCR